LASGRGQTFLDQDLATKSHWPSTSQGPSQGLNPADGAGHPTVGSAADSRRITQARDRGLGKDGLKADAQEKKASFTNLALVSRQPPPELISIDFLPVPTATFRVLEVLIVLAHDRRRVLHFHVTEHPTAAWTAQQLIEAFPDETAPRFLLRDRDPLNGEEFRQRVAGLKIEEGIPAARSPGQNASVERLIGSLRREWLDPGLVLGENHLGRILRSYYAYYDRTRTQLSLCQDAPEPRAKQPPEWGSVIEIAEVGGVHHRDERRAA